ncbi:MAG: DUF3990 domain-containing protein [Prevotellaceae bacterium]|jgi:hypothetical protein|nr:DUF3990 domain-containing protein [Prevotellaceae bacterium]
MKLYHGSTVGVETPDLQKCRPNTDFGQAFYTTTSFEQSAKWAKIKQRRATLESAVVSEFEIDENILHSEAYKVRFFEKATKDWLEFVINNRRGIESKEKYDFVMGPVANDSLYATILLYEQGVITADAAIEQLKTHTLFDQLSFHTEKALANLKYVKMITVCSKSEEVLSLQ